MATALAAYEAVRHRLPTPVAPRAAPQHAASLAAIADRFDVFLLDAFGVLNIGETAIPGVIDRIDDLTRAGKRVIVVSNAAGFPHARLMEKYARLGYSLAAEDVITSRATLMAALQAEPKRHWGLMATPSAGLGELAGFDVTYLEDDPAPYRAAEGILMIGSAAWTETRQALLAEALAERARPIWVGNPDIVAPREVGFSIEPGHYAHRLADMTGIRPSFFGKPFGGIFELAFQRLGTDIPRERIVMVGDSLHTDILGAQAAGIASALIADYGFFAGHDAPDAIDRTGISPDFILERP